MPSLCLHWNCLGFELHDGDRLITLYRAHEELPRNESPKPCFAPIYTPSGTLITDYRPADHPWHTGLYFGWVHVNQANLWGGPWYLPERGKYEQVEHSHGMQRHDRFTDVVTEADRITLTEQLTWLDPDDKPLVCESRRFAFSKLTPVSGYLWSITSIIEPQVDQLVMEASKAARYSGLELRMGSPFADAHHYSSEGTTGHESIMGARARWVAAAGATGGAVIMMDHPQNPRHPVTWFVRSKWFGAGFLMSGPLVLAPGETLTLRYGLSILDQKPTPAQVETLYQQYCTPR